MSWTERHQNWALLLWIILAPAICLGIYFILAFILFDPFPFLVMPIATAAVGACIISIFIVLLRFYQKKKRSME